MENKKAKTHKGRKYLESKLPKLVEDPKECVFINTNNSSEILRMVMNDLYLCRKFLSKKLSKKNKIESVFTNPQGIEHLCELNDTSLFCYSSDTKKRVMNLVLGSLFDNKILDMFEYEVTNFIPIEYFDTKLEIDSFLKPILVFQGDLFETDFELERIKKYFIDFFKLQDIEEVEITELRRVIVISVAEDKEIKLRMYQVSKFNEYNYKDNLTLSEIGPSLNLKIRRVQLASEELYKKSLMQPKELKIKKQKNIEKNLLGEKRGRVHMGRQNYDTIATKKYRKILGKKEKEFKNKLKQKKEDNDII